MVPNQQEPRHVRPTPFRSRQPDQRIPSGPGIPTRASPRHGDLREGSGVAHVSNPINPSNDVAWVVFKPDAQVRQPAPGRFTVTAVDGCDYDFRALVASPLSVSQAQAELDDRHAVITRFCERFQTEDLRRLGSLSNLTDAAASVVGHWESNRLADSVNWLEGELDKLGVSTDPDEDEESEG